MQDAVRALIPSRTLRTMENGKEEKITVHIWLKEKGSDLSKYIDELLKKTISKDNELFGCGCDDSQRVKDFVSGEDCQWTTLKPFINIFRML